MGRLGIRAQRAHRGNHLVAHLIPAAHPDRVGTLRAQAGETVIQRPDAVRELGRLFAGASPLAPAAILDPFAVLVDQSDKQGAFATLGLLQHPAAGHAVRCRIADRTGDGQRPRIGASYLV